MTDFKYKNNYAYPGINIIIYNIWLDDFFSTPNSNSSINIYEIGFEYKESGSSTWTSVCLAKSDSSFQNYIELCNQINSIWNQYKESELIEDYSYIAEANSTSANFSSNIIYPIKVVIRKLNQNTEYQIRAYYVGESRVTYNLSTIKTHNRLGERFTPEFTSNSGVSLENNNDPENPDDIKYYEIRLNNVITMLNDTIDFYYTQLPTSIIGLYLTDYLNGAKASSGYPIQMVKDYNNDEARTVIIHELGHNIMEINDSLYKEDIIKFMEFATHYPNASWIWMAKHNYPIISSARYTVVDDYKVLIGINLVNYLQLNQ